MRMESYVVNVGELFQIKKDGNERFGNGRKKYIIPKYQREYKWTIERAQTLFGDIKNRDKFIGNLIINQVDDYYEIVDGQQRITTLILILIALFNKNKSVQDNRINEEQKNLLKYIFRDNHPILENESVGNYISLVNNVINLEIDSTNDIYYQKDTFMDIYEAIKEEVDELDDIMSFQRKVLDCQVLVLIGETTGGHNESIEEIFLDINFKSQLLDVADIFKGYCFKNYFPENHTELKEQWTYIRKYTKEFEKIGYKDSSETSEYLYHYLLSCPDSYNIPASLSVRGKHYLEGKTNTQTRTLLVDMGQYGEHIMGFINKLDTGDYYFEDICSDAEGYLTDIENRNILKHMMKKIFLYTSAQYYKLPLFMFIHHIMKNDRLKNAFTYVQLKKLVTNYYAYTFFFINSDKTKSKGSIDRTIFIALNKVEGKSEEIVAEVLSATKELRKKGLMDYKQFERFDIEKAYAEYSFMDNYNATTNLIDKIYCLPTYNKEHLIVHSNTKRNVTWVEENNEFTFSLKQVMEEDPTRQDIKYTSLTSNYIIIPQTLNELLGHKDIVYKVIEIRNYYTSRQIIIPKHVDIFLHHIEEMDQYKCLNDIKGQGKEKEDIKRKYKDFINEYFSPIKQQQLYEKLQQALKGSFRQN